MVSATAALAASPTAPHFSQIRNTTGSPVCVIVHAGDECVAALDSVHEALLAQEIERAIDGNRRRPRTPRRQPVDQLIGAKRGMAGEQRLQHAAADRRQPLGARGADRLGMGNGVAGAALVVVTGRGKYRAGMGLFGQGALHRIGF